MPDNLIPIDLRVVILDNLGDGGYSVFGGVDVVVGARVGRGDERGEQRHGARARARELRAAELRQHAAPVRARLPHLRLGRAQPAQHRLQENILVLHACRS